jgi:hypothetical protein
MDSGGYQKENIEAYMPGVLSNPPKRAHFQSKKAIPASLKRHNLASGTGIGT